MTAEAKALIERFNQLVGKECWSTWAVDSAPNWLTLDFGEKVKRKTPLKNQSRPETERNFKGEFSLFIQCSWRIESKSEVVVNGRDENGGRYKVGGPTLKALGLLRGERVKSVAVEPSRFDVALEFENGLTLRVLADNVGKPNDNNENYTLFHEGSPYYTVDVKGLLSVGK